MLLVLRMAGVRDVAAIDEWVRLDADDDEARQGKDSLPGLSVGTAWVWSVGLQILQRVQIRRRRTFDPSATPKAGRTRVVAERMPAVELAALVDLFTVNDPADAAPAEVAVELRRRIAVLERRLAEAAASPRQVPVLTDDDRSTLRQLVKQAPPENGTARTWRPGPAGCCLVTPALQYPMQVSRCQLATFVGMSVRRGAFGTDSSTLLRRIGLVLVDDTIIRATDVLFTAPAVAR